MRCVGHVLGDIEAYGWTHHIPRLMVLGNLALLAGVDPLALSDWMWERIVDGAEWVMLPNVIGMALHADGGRMATKPYAAGGAYIDRMSDFCGGCAYDRKARTGERACPFTTLYWDFLLRHEKVLRANQRMALQVKNVDRLNAAQRADIRARAQKYGRSPDAIKIMPGVMPFVGASADEAQAKFQEMQDLIHPELGVRIVGDMIGVDLHGYDLDGPLPEAPQVMPSGQGGRQQVVLEMAKRDNLSIRQVYQRIAGARAHRIIHGTAKRIADDLEEWFTTGAADGFNIMPPMFPQGLKE